MLHAEKNGTLTNSCKDLVFTSICSDSNFQRQSSFNLSVLSVHQQHHAPPTAPPAPGQRSVRSERFLVWCERTKYVRTFSLTISAPAGTSTDHGSMRCEVGSSNVAQY